MRSAMRTVLSARCRRLGRDAAHEVLGRREARRIELIEQTDRPVDRVLARLQRNGAVVPCVSSAYARPPFAHPTILPRVMK